MPSNQVQVSSVLAAGTRTEFVAAYDKEYEGIKARLANAMTFDIPSDKLTEIFAYFTSAPHPRRWNRGEEATFQTFDDVSFSVTNRDYVTVVGWHENDEADDQTHSLAARAQQTGRNFSLLDERIFFQINLGSTDAELLPNIPNAPDGADLYNATNGAGGDRFGVSGGNIQSGETLTTAAGIRAAIFNATERFQQFQDTKGQPLFDASVVDAGLTIFYNVGNSQIFKEATIQGRTLQLHAGTSTTDTTAAAGVTNIVMESGLKITPVPTPRITGNNLHIYFDGVPFKPIFTLARQGMNETPFDRTNSDEGRLKKEKGLMFDNRRGHGVFLPYGTIQCTA